jgi:hypothetical protein
MTISIGLVCAGGKYILLAADTRGSYGTVSSNDQMAKIYDLPKKYCAAIAGEGSYCEDVISELYHRMDQIPDSEAAPEQVRKCIRDSYDKIGIESADEALRGALRITMERYLTDQKLAPKIRGEAKAILDSITIEGSLIVVGFYKDQPVQFVAEPSVDSGSLTVRIEITPGNALIGSGSFAAMNWLNYRKQNIHRGLAHSVLHLTEAKQFAEVEQTVGTFRQMVLLWPGNCQSLDWNPGAQNLVTTWWHRYGLPLSDGMEAPKHDGDFLNIFGLDGSPRQAG